MVQCTLLLSIQRENDEEANGACADPQQIWIKETQKFFILFWQVFQKFEIVSKLSFKN